MLTTVTSPLALFLCLPGNQTLISVEQHLSMSSVAITCNIKRSTMWIHVCSGCSRVDVFPPDLLTFLFEYKPDWIDSANSSPSWLPSAKAQVGKLSNRLCKHKFLSILVESAVILPKLYISSMTHQVFPWTSWWLYLLLKRKGWLGVWKNTNKERMRKNAKEKLLADSVFALMHFLFFLTEKTEEN